MSLGEEILFCFIFVLSPLHVAATRTSFNFFRWSLVASESCPLFSNKSYKSYHRGGESYNWPPPKNMKMIPIWGMNLPGLRQSIRRTLCVEVKLYPCCFFTLSCCVKLSHVMVWLPRRFCCLFQFLQFFHPIGLIREDINRQIHFLIIFCASSV